MPSGLSPSSTGAGCASSPQLELRPLAEMLPPSSVAQPVLPLGVVQTCHSVLRSVGCSESTLQWTYWCGKALLSENSLLENWLLGRVPALFREAVSMWRRGWRKPQAGMPGAESHSARQRTWQKDETKMRVWYLFSMYSNLKEEIPMNCSNCVSITRYLDTGTRL